MAKRINNPDEQGNQFFNSLMQGRPAAPIDTPVESQPEVRKPATSIAAVPEKEEPDAKNKETRSARCSIAVTPSELKDFKHVCYMLRIPVSTILHDYILNFINLHKDELEAFNKLSEAEKSRADSMKLG